MALLTEHTDSALLQLLAQNNQPAFEQIYARYWKELYQCAFFILKDRDATRDVVQDVFVWLWDHRHALDIQNLKAYLKAAVKFKVANYIRSGKIRNSFFDELARMHQSTAAPGADELAEVAELQRLVHQSVLALPQKCREVYRLSRETGLSNREIALRLGISHKTVEAQITIALRRLRSVVELHTIFLLVLLSFFN